LRDSSRLIKLSFIEFDLQTMMEEEHYADFAIMFRLLHVSRMPRKMDQGGPRMSPHALVQEYINLTEHLYAIVTNGIHLRLLRDSSRLIKLSFIEFDLQTMMEEEHYADFAIMFRLLHASRMPQKMDGGGESRIEAYHQDALESGSRIREGLSRAVENSIHSLANGFLAHPDNEDLREKIKTNAITAPAYYQYQLRLVYRLLFLMVIEERNLIYPRSADPAKREIYYSYYSVSRLRKLCQKPHLMDARCNDLWISLKNTFQLFENEARGGRLDVHPLAGDLFGGRAIGALNQCGLDNRTLLECLKNLSEFHHRKTGQKMRVNYASLNVEEFGSVYEGLLEYDPDITFPGRAPRFDFKKGSARSSSGSHYTPDELVQPLIKHSLDHIIEEKLAASPQKAGKEKALLSIKVCDVACGSGHILLNAARRIGAALARVRTGEDQPSPGPLRLAIRDVIGSCIYGVDKNPLAVELCKVALWMEAHNAGEPLNFLDHHVKCGDAIVGLAHKEELEEGVAMEAFKAMPGDDKKVRAGLAKRNRRERKERAQLRIDVGRVVDGSVTDITKLFNRFNALPETTIEEIEYKRAEYAKMTAGSNWMRLKTLADIQVAQFFIPKSEENAKNIVTDEEYMAYLSGLKNVHGMKAGAAGGIAATKRFFHWFLEFPEIFSRGGFDCIVGNPPYLGGQALSGTFGRPFCEWTRHAFEPAKGSDLVAFFLRRNYQIVKPDGFNAILTTNSIIDGKTREGGLEVIVRNLGGSINFAVRSTRWPGAANLYISLLGIVKGEWKGERVLDGRKVEYISSFFEDYPNLGDPMELHENIEQMFQGSIFLGKGFLLSHEYAKRLIANDPKNKKVISPVTNGQEVNNDPEQKPGRCIINFYDWSKESAEKYTEPFDIILEKVKPVRDKVNRKSNRENWWIYAERRPGLYKAIEIKTQCFVAARITKYLNFSSAPTDIVFLDTLYVYVNDSWSDFSILQSTIHNEWARKYSGALKLDLRYSPSNCFVTFPFPQDIPVGTDFDLENLGEEYHDFRRDLMLKIQLGLTKTYNQFHNPELKEFSDEEASALSKLKPKEFQKQHGKETFNLWKHLDKTEGVCAFNEAARDIFRLRELHREMDETVKKAYGWEDVDLAHGFYEMDYLPENDRVRYTISPDARKEILMRLLKLNHEIYEREAAMGLHEKKKPKKKKVKKKKKGGDDKQMQMF
ncbi:MAG: restriction endonuclease, partial [Desulfobacterales bacterium]|nr:restriction endonuclease [Desulfobacterales bacterium]